MGRSLPTPGARESLRRGLPSTGQFGIGTSLHMTTLVVVRHRLRQPNLLGGLALCSKVGEPVRY